MILFDYTFCGGSGFQQHFDSGGKYNPTVHPISINKKNGKHTIANVAQKPQICLSASSSYLYSASSVKGSRAQQTSCVYGIQNVNGPQFRPHESNIPALAVTNRGAIDMSADLLQQTKQGIVEIGKMRPNKLVLVLRNKQIKNYPLT
eukprot:m.346985 g.346985  ORF g.346985 m.346985 type:complete len:147 (+) comp30875_c0_seq1:44-484(+)